jgi:hypothetical protein
MMEAARRSQRAIVRFPTERVLRTARRDATYFDILKGRARQWLCRILNRAGVPSAIQPVEFDDQFTGQHVAVSVGELFMCISVGGRDYYFDRLTGRFDGTGTDCYSP